MKKLIALVLCLLMCAAMACAKPNTEVQQPAEATEAPEEHPETPAENPEAPAENPAEPEQATAAPEAEATEAPEDHSGDVELPELGGGNVDVITPDLVFDTVTLYGEPINSDIVKGYDLVIVNFWAEWCGPCVEELPAIEKIHQEYPNVLILGVLLSTDSIDDAKATLEAAGVTYPTLESNGTLDKYAGLSMYIPATYFFDAEGDETGEPVVGGQSYDQWKQLVESLLP